MVNPDPDDIDDGASPHDPIPDPSGSHPEPPVPAAIAPDDHPPPFHDAASPVEEWHSIVHSDLLVSVDAAEPAVSPGPSQREDVATVFRCKLKRQNVAEGDIAPVRAKVDGLRRWLTAAPPETPRDEAAFPGEGSGAEESPGCHSDATPSADWCYVDPPWRRAAASSSSSGFAVVHRDELQEPPPPEAKLSYSDLGVIEVLLDHVSAKWRCLLAQWVDGQPAGPTPDPGHTLIRDVLAIVDGFTQHLRPYFFHWYATGDVIFYDMDARRRLGVERTNLTLQLQKLYDSFSHSAIFLWDEGVPKVLHNLDVRVKVCSWKDCVYMAKREVDFHKIFAGFRFLPMDVQEEVGRRYKEAVVAKARQSKEYIVENLPFLRGLRYMCTARQFVPNPPLLRRAAAPSRPEGESPEPRPSALSDAIAAAAAPPPHDYSEMLCAGFTAGFLFECMREAQAQFPAFHEELAFTSAFLVDLDRMTPKDLHAWDVWRDSPQPCPLHDILHPEVLANRGKQPHLR